MRRGAKDEALRRHTDTSAAQNFLQFPTPVHLILLLLLCDTLCSVQQQGEVQAWIRGIYYFVGLGVGGVVGGELIESFGYAVMYRAGAIFLAIWAPIFFVLWGHMEKKRKGEEAAQSLAF